MPLPLTGAGVSKAKKKDQQQFQPPTPPRWKGRDLLDLTHQLNLHFFELMSALARSSSAWPLVTLDRGLWSMLDAEALARAARFPFVVLDVHFLSETWWRDVIKGVASATPEGWPASIAEPLMNETLIFAWHTAKWERGVARLSLGMLPAVAELIAALTPQQLSQIPKEHSGALRLRWAEDKDFWTRLLLAARDGDEETLADIYLHASLRLSGALLID